MHMLSWLSFYYLYCFDSDCHYFVILSFASSRWLVRELPCLLFAAFELFQALTLPLTRFKGPHYSTWCNFVILIFPVSKALLQIDYSCCLKLPQSCRQPYTTHRIYGSPRSWSQALDSYPRHLAMYLLLSNSSSSYLRCCFLCWTPCDTASLLAVNFDLVRLFFVVVQLKGCLV